METSKADLQNLEDAMRLFFLTFKSPAYWDRVIGGDGINLDRLAAAILQILAMSPGKPSNVQHLAHLLRVEAPSITRKTQELESLGMLARNHDESDKRYTNITVTEKGTAVAAQLRQAQSEIIENALRQWSAEEKRNFADLLSRFSQDFSKFINQDIQHLENRKA